MVDIYKWMAKKGAQLQSSNYEEIYIGFGIESPHSSKWRFVMRGLWRDNAANNANGCVHWSAPIDADLDVDTGNFFQGAGISIQDVGLQRTKTLQEFNFANDSDVYDDAGLGGIDGSINWMRSWNGGGVFDSRQTMLFDSDGKWFFIVVVPSKNRTAGLFGLVGEDEYHPGVLAHCHMSSRVNNLLGGDGKDYLDFTTDYAFNRSGRGIDARLQPILLTGVQYGYGSANDFFWNQSNAQRNPFSKDEWIHPLILVASSRSNPLASLREAEAVYQGRANMTPMSVFGSINGNGDSFSIVGTTVTLTDSAGEFTADMVGKEVTISGATSGGNDGTFVVTGQTPTTLTYENASGVTEAFTGDWSVNMALYIHFHNGLCIDWMGERVS
jgi:hypothetical protein